MRGETEWQKQVFSLPMDMAVIPPQLRGRLVQQARMAEGTCRMNHVLLYDEEGVEGIECDECGWIDVHGWDEPMPERCPGCKAKVVAE